MIPAIHLRNLHKKYKVVERDAGMRAALRSLVHRHRVEIPAVDGISFDLAPGEIVCFLGLNGAGRLLRRFYQRKNFIHRPSVKPTYRLIRLSKIKSGHCCLAIYRRSQEGLVAHQLLKMREP